MGRGRGDASGSDGYLGGFSDDVRLYDRQLDGDELGELAVLPN